jgi:putative phosphotransacetylase
MTAEPSTASRSSVEALVREALYRQLGRRTPAGPAPVLVVNSSARHMHISPENLEILFGKGAQLTVHKMLYQEGQFASQQTVTLIGPRKRIIPNLPGPLPQPHAGGAFADGLRPTWHRPSDPRLR